MRVALIGYGSIGHKLEELLANAGTAELVGVLVRTTPETDDPVRHVHDLDGLLALEPDVVVECAGQAALAALALPVIASGRRLVAASVGALADQKLLAKLRAAAGESGGQIVVPAGALGGIDALAAARRGAIQQVRYRGTKPASAWRGTPAEQSFDLGRLETPTVIFQGDAREAALRFPKNSNVAATVALAGVGFARTRVELVADPRGSENIHQLAVISDAVSFDLTLSGKPSADNPKTSALTALSLARAVANIGAAIAI